MKKIMIMVMVAILHLPAQAECYGTVEYCLFKYEMEKEEIKRLTDRQRIESQLYLWYDAQRYNNGYDFSLP